MEDRTTISSSRLTSSDVARATFSPARRGFDPREVRSFLEQVARELVGAERRIAELREHVADAERRALNPVLDEATLASALGTQSAAILRTAHEEAQRVVTAAQARASATTVEAQQHAAATVAEAEHAASALEADARAAAERLIDSAKTNGDGLVDRAREQGRTIVDEAQETRRKVLTDLLVRRKTLHIQIEQLRAARDSLLHSMQTLQSSVESTMSELEGSDDRARQAAIERLRSRPTPPPIGDESVDRPAGAADHPSGGTPSPELDQDPDAVDEIFAKLRKASLEERGTDDVVRPLTPSPSRADTPVGAILQRRDEVVAGSRDALVRKVKR